MKLMFVSHPSDLLAVDLLIQSYLKNIMTFEHNNFERKKDFAQIANLIKKIDNS